MDYMEEITRMLKASDEKTQRLTYHFLIGLRSGQRKDKKKD